MKPVDLTDLMRAPYVLGGRSVQTGLDCYGTVQEIARRKGLPFPDAWRQIEADWRSGGLQPSSGFGPGWRRSPDTWPTVRDGDVLVCLGRHHFCMIVHAGYLWSANPEVGHPFGVPLHRWTHAPLEIWRHDSTAHQDRPAG